MNTSYVKHMQLKGKGKKSKFHTKIFPPPSVIRMEADQFFLTILYYYVRY